ncbi:sulfur carrier protein [Allopseudospirillum japonicum]|uniref:Sulfur carrier protein n=1 Tax=Allopseudospirillum japonicum TaxID=64971 RepID=A0A1H6RTW7_9GAMM|nr:sulfur carrier protein ThiS [Allopseudospirillum japonicum]SEI55987.1 sulfur carrier protein [Allopseudospirillum japonicum]
MQIQLNGQAYHLDQDTLSVQTLLEHLKLTDKRVAVEVNEHVIPRSQHPKTQLQTGDKVEIVQAIGGG